MINIKGKIRLEVLYLYKVIIAFDDDYADVGILELCGLDVAMGNAIEKVKNRAGIIIGSNDEDRIAVFVENMDGIT